MSATKIERAVRATAAAHRVEIDATVRPGFFDVALWAPRGSIFTDSGCHCSVLNVDARFGETVEPARHWREVAERLVAGLEPCRDLDCEYCTGTDG